MMRIPSPSSRGALAVRLSIFDTAWAFACPLLGLYLRDANIFLHSDVATIGLYCLVCAGFSVIAFFVFRVGDGITSYFSVHDALDVLKAVVSAELMTCVVLFSLTRLEGIPRSTPIIHALILAAGLITARVVARVLDEGDKTTNGKTVVAGENIIMIGATQLTSLYIKLL